MDHIDLDLTQSTNTAWKAIMDQKLRSASNFEIHCWLEEPAEIKMALRFGKVQPMDWPFGKVITGPVTPEFTSFLLDTPKPDDAGFYNKMTPFLSIFLDNGFSSEHYGTELNQA